MKMYLSIAVLLCCCCASAQHHSEGNSERNFYWINFGLGGMPGEQGITMGLSLNVSVGSNLLTLDYEGFSSQFISFFGPPDFSMTAYSLKVGKIWKQRITFQALQIGLGYAKIERAFKDGATGGFLSFPTYSTKTTGIFTLPIEAKVGLHAHVFSLNLVVGGHLNSEFSQAYIRIGMGLGIF